MSIRFLASFFLCALARVFAANWSESNTGLPSGAAGVRTLTVDRATPSTIYDRAFDGRVFKSTDGAASWGPFGSVV